VKLVTYVVVGIKHTRNVLGQITITDCLNIVTAVDYKIQPLASMKAC